MSYRIYIPVFLALLLCRCAASAQNMDTLHIQDRDTLMFGSKVLKISRIEKSEFDKVPATVFPDKSDERQNIMADEHAVTRNKDLLILTNKDNKEIIFENTSRKQNGDENGKYYFIDNLKDIGQWLVYSEYAETGDYILVSKQNGARTYLPKIPVISPGKKYVVCGTEAGNLRGMNSLYLYEVTDKQIKLTGEREFKTWGPGELRWKDDRTILCEIIEGDTISYIKITIE